MKKVLKTQMLMYALAMIVITCSCTVSKKVGSENSGYIQVPKNEKNSGSRYVKAKKMYCVKMPYKNIVKGEINTSRNYAGQP